MVEALVARIRYHIQKANFMGLKEAESTLLLGEAADAIEELSSADVRPVVLCRDCMYCQKDELGRWCFNDYENELSDEDFCSHGKRKESKT